jgi:hypothetical protein
MNIKRGIFRFWLAISVVWIAVVVVVFHIGVDANHAADAAPWEFAAAIIPPAMLWIGFSVAGWIIAGFMR